MVCGLRSVILLVLLCVPVWSSQLLYVYIDAESGLDNTGCLNYNSTSKACKSLHFVVEYLTRTNSVKIEIKSQQLNLTKSVEFNGTYSHLILSGSGNTTISCNTSSAGLAFVNVKDLTISSVTIKHCGAPRESTAVNSQKPYITEHLSVAIYLLNCTDVSIWHVDIRSSNGTGLSLYDTNGTVNIEYCNFIDNNVHNTKGGGGLHVEFTICSPGVVGICCDHKQRNHHSKYTIQNCIFMRNVAYSPLPEENFLLPFINTSVPRVGKGGGIYISIGADAAENTFTITSCLIVNNSANFAAGGLLVELLNSVHKNNISIYETVLKKNLCPGRYVGNGGGLIVDFMFYSQSYFHGIIPKSNSFLCYNCTIEHNSAYRGGGTSIFVTKRISTTQFENSIRFLYCTWTENISPLGSAVYISPGLWDYTLQGFLPVPVFFDCTFEFNSVIQTYHPSHASYNGLNVTFLGHGAIFVSELHIRFAGTSHFTGNKGSAVYLSSSVLEFDEDSNVIFHNNTGHNGGAIAMYGSSAIYINNGSTFNFTKNMAYLMGGAIYSETVGVLQLSYYNCFVQPAILENFKTNSIFYFKGNVAKNGGSIFATTFRSCRIFCPRHNFSTTKHPQEILQCIANFTFSESLNNASVIATEPDDFILNEETPLLIIPGAEHTLQLSVTDEANNSLSGIVYEAGVLSKDNVSIDPAFYQVSNNVICINGNVGDEAELHLNTYDVTLSINITLINCKPGYIPNKWTCECTATEYFGLESCIPNVLLKHGYWIGFCSKNHSRLCTGYCPDGFCSYHKMKPMSMTHPLPNDSSKLDYEICGPSRTGRLCGMCADNYSVYFHSSKYTCGSEGLCHLGWLFYLISEILPIAISFIIILVFNIRFTKGNANCFIFYAQILDALATNGNGSIDSPYFINVIQNIVALFYRPFNLDFFYLEQLSFCLWKGASVMDSLIMKYVAVGFAFLLVLLTILIARSRCRKYQSFARFYTPNSVLIHGLSAFFILCYSQCAQITFNILTYFCLYSIDLKCEEKVVNRIGFMNYLQGDHVKYAVIAIVVLIVMIIIPPLLLLIYPLLFKLLGFCKVSESKLAGVLWRMMPIQLLDSFQSSFKDNLRFFAGLYFLYRAIIHGVYAYSPTLLLFYAIVQLHLILILAVHSLFQPYKEKRHNIIDSLLFANLAIINGITIYNLAERGNDAVTRITVMTSIQTMLMLLPFLCVAATGGKRLIIMYKKSKLDTDNLPSLRSGISESVSLLRNS